MTAGSPLDWRRAVVLTHRWLGIGCGLLVLVWFVSGIVMMYARMPSLDPADRLQRLAPLDFSSATVTPARAAELAGVPSAAPERVRIGMIGDRPAYRFLAAGGWSAVFADDGQMLRGLDHDAALEVGRAMYPEHARTMRHDRTLDRPDQWTLQSRAFLPLHRIALGDERDTWIYVSDRTGEVVLAADGSARRWAYAGAIPHWLYFTAFRRHSTVWLQSMIVLSIAGVLLTSSGLIWGIRQAFFSKDSGLGPRRAGAECRTERSARERARGHRPRAVRVRSPYSGMLRWHHYTGLVFGLFAFTWTLSGLLSLDPWDWHPGTAPTPEQRRRIRGGPPWLDEVDIEQLRAAREAIAQSFPPEELELFSFRGEPFLLSYRSPDSSETTEAPRYRRSTSYEPSSFLSQALPFEHLVVSARKPERGAFETFDQASVLAAAHEAMPGSPVADVHWLADYDAYYYDRDGALALPVLRARFDDPARTWLYLDPRLGAIVRTEVTRTRLNRWLYRGFHRLDLPFLHRRRPLWDVVVIVLCLGGAALAATSAADGWRRVVRHARRLAGGRSGKRDGPVENRNSP